MAPRASSLALLVLMALAGCASLTLLPTDHRLGRGRLEPAAVQLGDEPWSITVLRDGFRGGEVRSAAAFGPGRYTARLRCDVPRGALCAFFFYQPGVGDAADEIDIEILGGTRRIMFTTWVAGRQTNHVEATLPFDPGADFHEYRIERRPERVAFLVDGQEMAAFAEGLPEAVMPLWLNAWWPVWLTPGPRERGTLHVEEIRWQS